MYNKNDGCQINGYREWYLNNHKLWFRGIWKNNSYIGYAEWSSLKETIYYIK